MSPRSTLELTALAPRLATLDGRPIAQPARTPTASVARHLVFAALRSALADARELERTSP